MNRVLIWKEGGITYEADQRHAEILARDLGVTSKPVLTPGSREDSLKASLVRGEKDSIDSTATKECGAALSTAEASEYRGLAARGNYLSQDRADTQYAVKEIARRMATPPSGLGIT